jgi:hypothetical protein
MDINITLPGCNRKKWTHTPPPKAQPKNNETPFERIATEIE